MDIIAQLTSKDDKHAWALAQQIIDESRTSGKWYAYFDDFASLLTHKKSLVVSRAVLILAALAKWDSENRFEMILPAFLSNINHKKAITARQSIKAAVQLGKANPQYIPAITACFHSMDLSKYKKSMRPLIEKDIAEAENTLSD